MERFTVGKWLTMMLNVEPEINLGEDLDNLYERMDKKGAESLGEAHSLDIDVSEPVDAFNFASDFVTYDFHISTSLVGMCRKLQDEVVDGVNWTYRHDKPRRTHMYETMQLVNDDKLGKIITTVHYGYYIPPAQERISYKALIPQYLVQKPFNMNRHRFDLARHNVAFIYPTHLGGLVDTFQLLRLYKEKLIPHGKFLGASDNVESILRLLVSFAGKCLSESEKCARNCPKGVNVMVYEKDEKEMVGGLIRRTGLITHGCGTSRYTLNKDNAYKFVPEMWDY